MIIFIFLETEPKLIEFINALQRHAQQNNKNVDFIDALEGCFRSDYKENSEKAIEVFKRYVNPEYPYYVEVVDRIRMNLSQENDLSLLKRFNEEFPPEKWDQLPRGSVVGQIAHWYPCFKARAAQRGIKCPVPNVIDKLDAKIGREIFLRTLIANISNNNEECFYRIRDKSNRYGHLQKQSYEGFLGDHGYFYKLLKKAYLEATINPDIEIINFLDRSTNASLKEQIQFIEEGKDFSITCGPVGHTIQIVIMEEILVVCDTGGVAEKHSFEIYRINKNKLNLTWLEKLKECKRRGSQKGFILLLDELIVDLEGQRHDLSDFSKGENFFICLKQIMGNCPWMSKEAAFYFYHFLKNFKEIVTEEEWKTGLKVSEETLKELLSRMTKTDEEFTKALSKALLRFLKKEMEGIRNGTSPLKPHWKFLLDVLVRPLRYNIPQEDTTMYTGYLAEIFRLCPLEELCSLMKGLKSRSYEFNLFSSLLAALSMFLQADLSQGEKNIQKVVFKHRQLVTAILECCPPDDIALKGSGSYSTLTLATLLEDEALLKRLLENVAVPSEEALTLAYKLGNNELALKFLNHQVVLLKQQDMFKELWETTTRCNQKLLEVKILPSSKIFEIKTLPTWKLFLQVLLDPLVQVPDWQFKYLLSNLFTFCPGEEVCSFVQNEIKPKILENEKLYDLVLGALNHFLETRLPKKEQWKELPEEQIMIGLKEVTIQCRQLVTNILECSPLGSEEANGQSLMMALTLGDEMLILRLIEKLQHVENLIQNLLAFAQMLNDEKMMLWLQNYKK
jgi:hypothetical protein